jgi:hypothetical protein
MKRVCVIGNSHIACLKTAWDQTGSRHADVSITFFGAPQRMCQHLSLQNGRLISPDDELTTYLRQTSGGASEIALDEFDVFALIGLEFGPLKAMQVAERVSYLDLDAGKPLVSRACFRQSVCDGLRKTIAVSVAQHIRAASTLPIVIVQTPHFAAKWRGSEDYRRDFASAPPHFWPALCETWRACARTVADDLTSDLLFQPPQTIVDAFFSDPRMTKDAIRLSTDAKPEKGDHQVRHMNAEYGKIMLEALLAPPAA